MREGGRHAGAISDRCQNAVDPPPANKNSHRPGIRQTWQGDLKQHAVHVQYAVLKLGKQVQTARTVICFITFQTRKRAYMLQIKQ